MGAGPERTPTQAPDWIKQPRLTRDDLPEIDGVSRETKTTERPLPEPDRWASMGPLYPLKWLF